MKPAVPPFFLTYWNPFDKYAPGIGQSFINYVKDISFADYTAAAVGSYIEEASENQIAVLESYNQEQINVLKEGFSFLNQALVRIEQKQINSNILLENIGELLKLPDFEKQRQRHIELGMKFSNQSLFDPDLAIDAKMELDTALSIMPQDWFVLQQLGILLLYQEIICDIPKAKEYFLKAAKYATVDLKSPGSLLINNLFKRRLTIPFLSEVDGGENLEDFIRECYLNSALSSYVLCEFDEAIKFAKKSSSSNPKSLFFTAKYLCRSENKLEGLDYLKQAFEHAPYLSIAACNDLDIKSNPQVIEYAIKSLNEYLEKIKTLKNRISEIRDFISNEIVFTLIAEFDNDVNVVRDYKILNEPLTAKDEKDALEDLGEEDALFQDAAKLVITSQSGSSSLLQRRMKLGYNRAGRIMDQLENAGVVGPNQGSKPRDVLIHSEYELRVLLANTETLSSNELETRKKELLQGYRVEDLWSKWNEIFDLIKVIKEEEKKVDDLKKLKEEEKLEEKLRFQKAEKKRESDQKVREQEQSESLQNTFNKIRQDALFNYEFNQHEEAYYNAIKGLKINSSDADLKHIQVSFESQLKASNKKGCYADIVIFIIIWLAISITNFYYDLNEEYGGFFGLFIIALIIFGIVRNIKRKSPLKKAKAMK